MQIFFSWQRNFCISVDVVVCMDGGVPLESTLRPLAIFGMVRLTALCCTLGILLVFTCANVAGGGGACFCSIGA